MHCSASAPCVTTVTRRPCLPHAVGGRMWGIDVFNPGSTHTEDFNPGYRIGFLKFFVSFHAWPHNQHAHALTASGAARARACNACWPASPARRPEPHASIKTGLKRFTR